MPLLQHCRSVFWISLCTNGRGNRPWGKITIGQMLFTFFVKLTKNGVSTQRMIVKQYMNHKEKKSAKVFLDA